MSITRDFLSKTNQLIVQPEISPGNHGFEMFNDAGTEVEVSEYLWATMRIIKPDLVLETGTHKGISSSYIARALEDNHRGKLITFEIILQHYQSAKSLWNDLGLSHRIDARLEDALQFNAEGLAFDILFLDSEPQLRFNEFVKFYPYLRPGGLILIHDLNQNLGHHGMTHHGIYDWPYGDFREKLGPYIKSNDIQTLSFSTPRGLSIFQKTAPGFVVTEYLKGVI